MSSEDEFPDLPTISDIFSEIELADGSNLDQKQVKRLVNMKRTDKTPLFRVEDSDLILNVIATIDKIGFDETVNYLKNVKDENHINIIKRSPIYLEVRKNNFMEITKDIVIKNIRQSIFKCPDCGGRNINVQVVQKRSSDEGATEIYTCLDCGHKKVM